MEPTVFFDRWRELATSVGRGLAGKLARYGWTADDGEQQACLRLWQLCSKPRIVKLPEPEVHRYLLVTLRRSVIRSARSQKTPMVTIEDAALNLIEDRGVGWAAEFLSELVVEAPKGIQEYLKVTVIDGMTWEQGTARLRCSRHEYARLRVRSARWLHSQLEATP